MNSEPCTPDEIELRDSYAGVMDEYVGQDYDQAKADAERGIAKIKADALREAAMRIQGRSVGSCNTGCHVSDMMTLQMLADQIEGEA